MKVNWDISDDSYALVKATCAHVVCTTDVLGNPESELKFA